MGLTLGIGMPQLHASAPLLSRCVPDGRWKPTLYNSQPQLSQAWHCILSSLPQEQPPMAHKESERFSRTPQKLPYPPGEVFPTFCLVIDLIMSEDHHSHGPTGELCGWWLIWLGVKIITPILQQVNFVAVWWCPHTQESDSRECELQGGRCVC